MKDEGHRSGGCWCLKILTKKAEGELTHGIYTTFKYARENNITGFSIKKAAAGYKWSHGFTGRNESLAVKKATQICHNRAGALTQQSVFNWFRQYVNEVILRYKITDPHRVWNVEETNVTNIPKDQKFIGERDKKLNQVVDSGRAETSTTIGCTNAAGESMPPLIIHRGVRVPASWIVMHHSTSESGQHKKDM